MGALAAIIVSRLGTRLGNTLCPQIRRCIFCNVMNSTITRYMAKSRLYETLKNFEDHIVACLIGSGTSSENSRLESLGICILIDCESLKTLDLEYFPSLLLHRANSAKSLQPICSLFQNLLALESGSNL